MTTGRINQVANPCVRQSPHATPRPGHAHTDPSSSSPGRGRREERCDAPRGCERAGSRTFHFWFVFVSSLAGEEAYERARASTQFLPSPHGIPSLPRDPIQRTAPESTRQSRRPSGMHTAAEDARDATCGRCSPARGRARTRGGSSGESPM